MSKKYFPAIIQKINNHNTYKRDDIEFVFILTNKNSDWNSTVICTPQQLMDLRDKINSLFEEVTLSEKLHITKEEADYFKNCYRVDELCKPCSYQKTQYCTTCLLQLESPLERKLYIKLVESGIYFRQQYPINKEGKIAHMSGPNWFENLLTRVDFFIPYKAKKICLYADGHTYHERTEEQAMRDRNIDRQLQQLGFTVLRYPGKEIRENCERIIEEIKRLITREE